MKIYEKVLIKIELLIVKIEEKGRSCLWESNGNTDITPMVVYYFRNKINFSVLNVLVEIGFNGAKRSAKHPKIGQFRKN